jgi:hypothetical protein
MKITQQQAAEPVVDCQLQYCPKPPPGPVVKDTAPRESCMNSYTTRAGGARAAQRSTCPFLPPVTGLLLVFGLFG